MVGCGRCWKKVGKKWVAVWIDADKVTVFFHPHCYHIEQTRGELKNYSPITELGWDRPPYSRKQGGGNDE